MYKQMLDTYEVFCHVTEPTRKWKNLVDLISTNSKIKILYDNVMPCPTVSDHDAPYIFVDLPTNKNELWCKFIRNLKAFDLESLINNFKTLTFTTVYSFDDTDDQSGMQNKF